MTIIKKLNPLSNYPFKYLDQALVEGVEGEWVTQSAYLTETAHRTVLLPLECYCELTDQSLSLEQLLCPGFGRVILGFASTFKGESLVQMTAEYKKILFDHFLRALGSLGRSLFSADPEWISEFNWRKTVVALNLNEDEYSQDTKVYWSGYRLYDRKNKQYFLRLGPLCQSHGQKFTMEYYSRIRAYAAKMSKPQLNLFIRFAEFLSENSEAWPVSTFDDPIKITQLFKAYLKHYFQLTYDAGNNINSAISKWNKFISCITELFIDSEVWATPFGKGLPKVPQLKVKEGSKRISHNEDGVKVHNKLLTDVPLQYTDDQAIEVLFNSIESDLNTVKRWAREQAYILRSKHKNYLRLAKSGKPWKYNELGFYPTALEDLCFSDVCATIHKFGFSSEFKKTKGSIFYARKFSLTEVADRIGMPKRHSLFPFMALLVIEHPKITPSFLLELDLYDKDGRLTGFIRTDAGYQLTGYKDRRRARKSEQKILLSPRSASLIRQVKEITDPLRDFLRSKGDDNWRKLFLTCGTGFNYPRPAPNSAWKGHANVRKISEEYRREIIDQISRSSDLTGDESLRFARRVTLESIRASAGVLVYLRTQSVEKMAEALGHDKYRANVLDLYLPEPIRAFFQTRWIRIFQRAFICYAMKDSPFLMQATDFSSMSELHQFLENHALKNIPGHLTDPENTASTAKSERSSDQVFISIDSGVLSALLSLKDAVENSKHPTRIAGLAKYWAKVSSLIEREIVSGSDSLLKEHLSAARENLNPAKMEKLIYESAA